MLLRRSLLMLALAGAALALLPAAAQAARTPQIRAAFVINPLYCTNYGITPRLQVTLSAPGTVTLWTYQVALNGTNLPLPKKSSGPRTTTLPEGTSTLPFDVVFGKRPGAFTRQAGQVFIALPHTGWQVGNLFVDTKGFSNVCL
jgi:hypothetical protein